MIEEPFILYDNQAFDLQRFGGISRYFCEIMHRLHINYDISVRYSINYYITHWSLGKHQIPLPRFIFKNYRKYFQLKNRELTKRLLQTTSRPYLFHPTYYDPSFLEYIGEHPYIITVHDMTHEKLPHYFSDAEIVTKNKREVITRANRIIAISENTKKDIVELLHINPDKIDVIYHGTSMEPFYGRQSLQLPKKYLLFVGDRTPYKNFDRFLKAFSILSQEDKELSLVCTGNRFSKSEKEQLSKLKIENKVIQIRASDRSLSELYNRAVLFVFPSLYEGFGIPILEAYACHCPVVLSNSSCFPEIAGKAAVYFDPYSERAIAEAIKSVVYNKERRVELIRMGDEQLKLYSWEKAAYQTEESYKRALNN